MVSVTMAESVVTAAVRPAATGFGPGLTMYVRELPDVELTRVTFSLVAIY
jgi:hypothetical protein